MTEPFKVPEPSEAAVNAALNGGYLTPSRMMLCAAYAVDVPGIVKQEVERAMDYAVTWKGNFQSCREYMAARFPCDHLWSDPRKDAPPVTCLRCGAPKIVRFPEAAPETDCDHDWVGEFGFRSDKCLKCGERRPWPPRVTESTPRPTPSAPATHCGMSNDGEDASRCTLPFAHPGLCQRPKDDETTCAKCGERTGHLTWCEYNRVPSMAGARPEVGSLKLEGLMPGRAGYTALTLAEREFVWALAEVHSQGRDTGWLGELSEKQRALILAARRVVGEAKP